MKLQHIGSLEAIPRLGARIVETQRGPVAVFRTADDEVFALDDRCPHGRGPLSQGIVHGKQVTCPLHAWKICLDTGSAAPPDEGCTASHAVEVTDGQVYLSVA